MMNFTAKHPAIASLIVIMCMVILGLIGNSGKLITSKIEYPTQVNGKCVEEVWRVSQYQLEKFDGDAFAFVRSIKKKNPNREPYYSYSCMDQIKN